MRQNLIYWCIPAIVTACATTGSSPRGVKLVPPSALAAVMLGVLPESPWLKEAQALCISLVLPGKPPSIVERFLPPFKSLVDLPDEAQSELAAFDARLHRWSNCQVNIVTRSDVRVPGSVSVKDTNTRALLVWMRDPVLTSDSTAIGEVGYWVGGDSSIYACEAVLKDGVWRSTGCKSVGVS